MKANDRLLVPCIVFLVLVGTLMAVVLRHGPGEDRSRKADDIVVDAGKSSAVTQAPRPTRGISPKDTSLPLDRIKKLGRTLTVQHLRDIVDLPTSFSADLDVLKRRAVAAAKVVPDGNTDGYVVKYYSGVNHTHHGLLENGVTGFASKPLAGVYFTEHCFDGDGKIVKAIANDKDGTRFVDRTFRYEGNRPSAMLTYGRAVIALEITAYTGRDACTWSRDLMPPETSGPASAYFTRTTARITPSDTSPVEQAHGSRSPICTLMPCTSKAAPT